MNFNAKELSLIFLTLTHWNYIGRVLPSEREAFDLLMIRVADELFKTAKEEGIT